jgi:nucleoside-diphosphate-sugar epimerase
MAGSDAVVHLAAITDAAGSVARAREVEEVNYRGTERIARACMASNVPLIFLSTTSVYGTQEEVVGEDCPVDDLKPQSPYAESKLKAENLLRELGGESLRYITLRFGTIVGPSPGMRFHTAVNKFAWQACLGQPITVWSTAMDQNRPYLDLRDGVSALAFILGNKHYPNEVFNVLTANTSVRQIIEAIKVHIDDLSVEYVESPIMNQLSYNVRRGKFEALGFKFQGSIEDAIADTVAILGKLHQQQR